MCLLKPGRPDEPAFFQSPGRAWHGKGLFGMARVLPPDKKEKPPGDGGFLFCLQNYLSVFQGMAHSASAFGSRIHTDGVTRRVNPAPSLVTHSRIGSSGRP